MSAFVPLAIDLYWATKIAVDNVRNGFPTYSPGHSYGGLVFPSGFTFPSCEVKKVSFKTVTFATMENKPKTIQVKKSLLASGKVMSIGID